MNGSNRFSSMRKVYLQVLVIAVFVVPGISAVSAAQPADFSDEAADLAKVLDQSKLGAMLGSGVVVFDFTGPDASVTLFGRDLADDFSSALSKFNGRFYVVDRSYLAQAIERKRLAPIAIEDEDLRYWIAQAVGARALVVGKISRKDKDLSLELDCFRVADRAPIRKIIVASAVTADMERRLQTNVDADARVEARNLKTSGSSVPICVKCGDELVDHHLNAKEKSRIIVLLLAVVGVDGKARDLQVLKGSSKSTTMKAVEEVQNWEFVPAKGADGKPIAVRTPLEVTIALY
jgi:hypothetical protein